MAAILKFARAHAMPCIAGLAAVVSAFFVHPSASYLSYVDWHTMLCLFSMLAVLCALRGTGAFRKLALALARRCPSTRMLCLGMTLLTFVASMFITNDMALLAFLPLTATALSSCNRQKAILPAFVLQTIAANLGGMIMPFGNPQNLYLFSYFDMGLPAFLKVMAPPTLLALVLLVVCCLLQRKESLAPQAEAGKSVAHGKAAVCIVLFVLVISMVFKLVPAWLGCVVVVVVLLIADRQALARVDYGLLLTFLFFFVFSGNLASIPQVQELLSTLMAKSSFLVAVVCSQVISNVPSAIVLAPFTNDWAGLLLGVDVGGVGTIVGSLASLIALAQYNRCMPGHAGRFMAVFSGYNFAYLIVFVAATLLFWV